MNSLDALRTQRQTVLDYCSTLTPEEWAAPSHAAGWSVKDVVAHMGTEMRSLITPAAIPAVFTNEIERLNDRVVSKTRAWSAEQTLDDFRTWSSRGIAALRVFTVPGVNRVPLRMGDLGFYPLSILPSTFVFDWDTHLRYDIAPAVGRPIPPASADQTSAILPWLMLLLERSHRRQLSWLDSPVTLKLDGPGGGTWNVSPAKGKIQVRKGPGSGSTRIEARAVEFPEWSTRRASWRDRDVKISGDSELGERFLDSLNLI